jgi:PmbA protein
MNKTQQRLESLAAFVVTKARQYGATDCEVSISESESVEIGVRLGEVEELNGAQGRGLRFRALVGFNSASTTTSDFRRDAVARMIKATVAMAKASEGDEFAGLPEAHMFAKSLPALDLFDESLGKVNEDDKIKLALKAEAAARAADPRISNSNGAGFSDTRGYSVFANSRGFVGSYGGTSCGLHVSVLASENGGPMQVGGWSSSSRRFADIETPESIGAEAARRALRHLGARKVKTQAVPVVFDQQMAARILGQLVGAAHGSHVYRKSSFLAGKIGEIIAAKDLVIVDDGTIKGAMGSRPFDEEGLPVVRRVLVEDGKLQSYLMDSYSARKLGVTPNSGSVCNLFIQAGKHTPAEIIASVQNGLYLTSVSGPGFNAVTGDYSMGASGIWIENGELAYPVEKITVAGNLLEMFKSIEMIGSDLEFRSRVVAPTLKIAKMQVSGK